MKIGVVGSGDVGQTLARGFAQDGHDVAIATRDPGRLADFAAANRGIAVKSPLETARHGDVIVLAVKGTALRDVLATIAGELAEKVVIDATNPIGDEAPVDGVLELTTAGGESSLERSQREVPAARFVKAFNSVGADLMVRPSFSEGRPTMFVCGNDAAAKTTVAGLLDAFGWESADMGTARAARAIEPLSVLWCIPGFRDNSWMHAFKLMRPAT